ncbi:MAG: BatA domain-containing protein, partial [Alphaproteobacteria bacterium]
MLSIGALSFAAPWLLVALAGLPILWWLLRVTPPAPRLLRFPAILLLFGLNQDEQTPSRTPWWLILLRMIVVTLVILGLAHPLWNAGDRFGASGPLVMVVDDGFAAARGWTERQKTMENLIARAERTSRPVMLLGTAPPADGAPIRATNLLTPAAARSAAQILQPKPWPTARGRALEAFRAARFDDPANIVWLSDGVDVGKAQEFVRVLQQRGSVTVMNDPRGAGAVALVPPPAGDPRLIL